MQKKRYTHFLRIDFHRALRLFYNKFRKECEKEVFYDGAGNNSVFFGFYEKEKRDHAAKVFYTDINKTSHLEVERQQEGVLFVKKKGK